MAILTTKPSKPREIGNFRKLIYAAKAAEKVKDTKGNAVRSIIESYRRRIKALYPKAEFDTEFVLGATIPQFVEHIEAHLQPGMTWQNYGDWVMSHREIAARWGVGGLKGLSDPDVFYKYFHYSNRIPKWRRGKGFVADPDAPSPLDRDADQV